MCVAKVTRELLFTLLRRKLGVWWCHLHVCSVCFLTFNGNWRGRSELITLNTESHFALNLHIGWNELTEKNNRLWKQISWLLSTKLRQNLSPAAQPPSSIGWKFQPASSACFRLQGFWFWGSFLLLNAYLYMFIQPLCCSSNFNGNTLTMQLLNIVEISFLNAKKKKKKSWNPASVFQLCHFLLVFSLFLPANQVLLPLTSPPPSHPSKLRLTSALMCFTSV